MSDADHAKAAKDHFQRTTIKYSDWAHYVKVGKYHPPDGSTTEWGMGFAELDAIIGGSTPPPSSTYKQLFSPNSAMNKKIPVGTPYHPDSDAMTKNSNTWNNGQSWLGPYAPAILWAVGFAGVPTQQVYASEQGGWINNVPIPQIWHDILNQAPWNNNPGYYGGDTCTFIYDPATGDAWSGYHLTPPEQPSRNGQPSGQWNAVHMAYQPGEMTKLGCAPEPWQPPSGSGIVAGYITQEDINSSDDCINHAIQMTTNCQSYQNDVHPFWVDPATGAANDGQVHGVAGIPTGARFQLDPSLNVDTWPSLQDSSYPAGVAKMFRKLCKTAQQYGFIHVDGLDYGGQAGGLLKFAQYNKLGTNQYPFDTSMSGWNTFLPADIMSRFHIIDWTKWTGV
jgi:hypothetical protein